ncbi:MAG: hypothetical protein IMW99_09295 [Firmicutes bacterium]|nr:hypothetical protein [Bacillota bacterium]
MNWLRVFWDVITSEEVMRPLIILVAGIISHQVQKYHKHQIASEIIVDVVDYVEEHYQQWGIRGSAKLERFMELFEAEFTKAMGRRPTAAERETAKIKAEAAVCRARRLAAAGGAGAPHRQAASAANAESTRPGRQAGAAPALAVGTKQARA